LHNPLSSSAGICSPSDWILLLTRASILILE
jgi:hypothetical protein